MSRLECERWASLLDREALDGALSGEDAVFQERHARVCQHCAHELARWRELSSLGQGGALERDVALEEAVLAELWQRPAFSAVRPLQAPRRVVALGAVLAAAAAALLFFALRRDPTRPTASPLAPARSSPLAHATIGSGRALMADDTPRMPGAPIEAGSRLRATQQPLCLLIEPAVRTCLSPGGELRVADLTFSQRRIELIRGRLVTSLEPQPVGSTFSVSGGIVTVTAVGTIFTVDVPADSDGVVVRVLHGRVKVRSQVDPERTLVAHQRLAFGSHALAGVSPAEERDDLALLHVEPEPPATAIPEALPSAALPAETSAGTSKTARPAAEPRDPSSLLREAVELRAEGRFADAARTYRQLAAQFPASSEARAALVSLGDLQLSRLGQAEAALGSFDAYLKSGDRGLAQEAEYGRIRALRALGRSQQEAQAIEQLLQRHPTGVHAESMRARLASLRGDASR